MNDTPLTLWAGISQDASAIRELDPDAEPVAISKRLEFFWSTRADLRDMFDLSSLEGRAGLLAWWLGYGFDSLKGVAEITDSRSLERALRPVSFLPDDGPMPVTWMLYGLWKAFDKFRNEIFTLDTPLGRLATTTCWSLYLPVVAPGHLPLDPLVERFLAGPVAVDGHGFKITAAELLVYRQIFRTYEVDWQRADHSPEEIRCWYYLSAAAGQQPYRCIIPDGMTAATLVTHLRELVPAVLERHQWLSAYLGI